MKSAATIFAAIASMGLVSACATANGQTSSDDTAPALAPLYDSGDGGRHIFVRRIVRGGGVDGIIENYDSDDDGKISEEEYNDRSNRGRFDALDANDDGFIDKAELELDMEARMAEREARWAEGEGLRAERMAERTGRHVERLMRDAERMAQRAERLGEDVLAELDRNGDGEINEDDFDFDFDFKFDMEGLGERMQERMQKHRERALKELDKNGDGAVDREEFAARQNKRFDELDKDDSGTLSADELDGMAMMRSFTLRGLPHFERFGMGRGDGGPHMFFWSDEDDDEDGQEKEEQAEE